jgi:tRNA pseudouridine55 synthase
MEEQAQPPSLAQLASGSMLLVDKPTDWTSFDVVNKIRGHLRRALGIKKIKVGHSGTLDPMATGLLLICTGKWTKKLADLQGMDKSYTGTLRLGATTPSYDAETEIDHTYPFEHITTDDLETARQSLCGPQEQVPPVFSAIKVDGQPLYKRARRGEIVEVKARPVVIRDFELRRVELPDVDFFVSCSKGTYIRSLSYDFGRALDSGAYLTALRRTTIGDYRIEDAWELEALLDHIDGLVADPI